MRLLRDSLPFAVFGAPLTVLARQLLLRLAALGAVSFAGGLFLRWKVRRDG